MPGFVKVITAADIPQGGKNNFNTDKHAIEEVCVVPQKVYYF